jgi:hypothetical protein
VRRLTLVVAPLVVAAGGAGWRLAGVKPDPNVQAVADGCRRDTTKIYTGFAPNWVYVDDKDYPAAGPTPPPQRLSGVISSPASGPLAAEVSPEDDPITHMAFDFNMDVTVAAADDFLTGTSRDGTPEAGTIHIERDSAFYPIWAWPQPASAGRSRSPSSTSGCTSIGC